MIFGGNAYVNRTEPGSARDAVNKLKILQFGELDIVTHVNATLLLYSPYIEILILKN